MGTILHRGVVRPILLDEQTQRAQRGLVLAQLKDGHLRALVVDFMLKLCDALWKFRAMHLEGREKGHES